MPYRIGVGVYSLILAVLLAATIQAAGDKLWTGHKVLSVDSSRQNTVVHPCLTPKMGDGHPIWNLPRRKPWSLPSQALAPDADTTIHVLVIRVNFQYETVDDPNTTGRGVMNILRPMASPAESAAYYDSVGHWIDPPPHNAAYFSAHMRALNLYWSRASLGHDSLAWDIYPKAEDSCYHLSHQMNYYGKCEMDSVVAGLERFFVDAIQVADTTDPEIDFSQYDAIIIFHAGSDRQNDIGFPPTCNDLFTGFIRFKDSVLVDSGRTSVKSAVMMPETASQDNRATALNAVMAHEFGHQLGLVDLYNTRTFITQLGDFSLMDNNGFGTGIDFGFKAGKVFGAIPIFPDAWSRAYLGYDPVVDYRQGSDVRIVAAELANSSSGLKIARVPISENEYYLIENRIEDIDGKQAYARVDSTTNVILGPADANRNFTGEYGFLLPGSGMLIYLVDEGVMGLDYDGDGVSNFQDNELQWDPNRKFITLVEADGVTHFGGYYYVGFGEPGDMFRDDRKTSFTPNTNPPAVDNSGNDTHINITHIGRDTIRYPGEPQVTRLDSVMRFDIETDHMTAGFPVRAGYPKYGLSPIADDIDRDGVPELIMGSGKILTVTTPLGENFLQKKSGCATCPVYYDTAKASTNPGTPQPLPVYALLPEVISAGPVTGDFGESDSSKLVAVGYQFGTVGRVVMFKPQDLNADGLADPAGIPATLTDGIPIAMSFGKVLWVLTADTSGKGTVYRKDALNPTSIFSIQIVLPGTHDFAGICRIADQLVVLTDDSTGSVMYYLNGTGDTASFELGRQYTLGPITVDINRDGLPEVAAFSVDGGGIYVTVDTTGASPTFTLLRQAETGYHFTVNPIVGDVDMDGFPDVIIAGTNTVYAFDDKLIVKTNFPFTVDDRYPTTDVIAALVTGDISTGGLPELVFPTDIGNIYSYGYSTIDMPIPGAVSMYSGGNAAYLRTTGFPLSGGEKGAGSSLIYRDSNRVKLGYLGIDGWFYSWDMPGGEIPDYWPMGGHDPAGSFEFDNSVLSTPTSPSDDFSNAQFYNYPNPVTGGVTTFRYTLGADARKVTLTVYDLTGKRIQDIEGSASRGENQQTWDCSGVTPGVYRCRINVDFSSGTKTGFCDVAVIR